MLLLKSLIRQQMKKKNITYADLALRTGIPYIKIRDYIHNMQSQEKYQVLEKVMIVLELFNFDNKDVDKLMKKELKKLEKKKEDYIY